jgi:hypothetical protein
MQQYFMPYGKKYSGHMPFGKGSGQCNSTLCHMAARSIQGTCLLARARGNAPVLYAIWQEGGVGPTGGQAGAGSARCSLCLCSCRACDFWAHAIWQGLGAMQQYFMPYGKKYSWHMPFLARAPAVSIFQLGWAPANLAPATPLPQHHPRLRGGGLEPAARPTPPSD